MMVNIIFFLFRPFGDQWCLNGLKLVGGSIGDINNCKRPDFNTTFDSLCLTTPKSFNIRRLLPDFAEIRRIICQNEFFRTGRSDKLCIEANPIEWSFHLIPVRLFIVATISGHIDKISFPTESHIQNQCATDKFLRWLDRVINLCYYCIVKALSFIEKHLLLWFWSTTNEMLFSLSSMPF